MPEQGSWRPRQCGRSNKGQIGENPKRDIRSCEHSSGKHAAWVRDQHAPFQLAGRTSVSSTSVTVITPGAGCSITSTATVSTAGATGRAAFFPGARLGLVLAAAPAATAFPRVALDSFLALGRAFAPFLFWTFDDCFLRLAMVDPLVGAPQTH